MTIQELVNRLLKVVEANESKREHDDLFSIWYVPYFKEWHVTNEHYENDSETGRPRIDGKGITMREALEDAIRNLTL